MSKELKKVISAGFLLHWNGKYLIGLPPDRCGTTGGWGIPKGRQDAGEKLLTTALREFWEETALELRNESIDGNIHFEEEPFYSYKVVAKEDKTVFVYRAYATIKPEKDWLKDYPFKCLTYLKNGKPEIEQYKWVTPEEAIQLVVKSQRQVFEFVKNYKDVDGNKEIRSYTGNQPALQA